jgi:hypothetical protein
MTQVLRTGLNELRTALRVRNTSLHLLKSI